MCVRVSTNMLIIVKRKFRNNKISHHNFNMNNLDKHDQVRNRTINLLSQ